MDPVTAFGWNPVNVPSEDTLVHTGQCIMHSIVVNGLSTAGYCSVYDGVDNTGTLIAGLRLDPTISISVQPITLLYDCKMAVGIFVDFDANLAADLTVTWG